MKKEIIYTDSASSKIDKIMVDFRKRLEEDIINYKNYPGEEEIEITASDIESAYDRVRIIRGYSKSPTLRMTKLLLPTYFIAGVFLMIYGLFYTQIRSLISDSPEQLAYILSGFALSLVTGAMYYLMKIREQERKKDIFIKKIEKLESDDV